jgi:hypothetical protein
MRGRAEGIGRGGEKNRGSYGKGRNIGKRRSIEGKGREEYSI